MISFLMEQSHNNGGKLETQFPVLLGKAIGNSILKTYKEQKKLQPHSYGSVEELIAAVRAHAFDYKKLDSEKQIRNTNL